MAKKRSQSLALRNAPTMVMMAPRATRRARAGALVRRAKPHAKRAAHAVGGALWKQKTTLASVAGAGVVGYLEGAGHLDFIPDLVPGADAVGRIPTIAIATYVIGHVTKSPKLKHAGVGLAAAAAFGFGLDKGKSAKK